MTTLQALMQLYLLTESIADNIAAWASQQRNIWFLLIDRNISDLKDEATNVYTLRDYFRYHYDSVITKQTILRAIIAESEYQLNV